MRKAAPLAIMRLTTNERTKAMLRAGSKKAVIIRCIWSKKQCDDGHFVLKHQRFYGFAKRAHSHVYDLTLFVPAKGIIQKGDRIELSGNYSGLYQVLTIAKHCGKEHALLQKVRINNRNK